MPITWDENAPANGDAASSGDDAIRALKVAIASGVSVSMYFPGSGGGSAASAGIMKLGAARTFVGTQSQVSAAQSGQLMFTSDTSRLFYVGPTGPAYLGGQFGLECATNPGTGVRWVVSSGTAVPQETKVYGLTYGAIPRVVCSFWTTADKGGMPVATPAVANCVYQVYTEDILVQYPASAGTVFWMSIGTIAV